MEKFSLNPESLYLCLQTARAAGVPSEQAQRLLESGYIPLPWQWEFHAAAREADYPEGPVDIGCGGARGPGKSHAVLSQVGIDDCQRIPGLKGLFLRQTGVAAKESFDDLVEKVLKGRVAYTKTGTILKFTNGSRIVLGGFQDQNDIDKYIGIEYDFIIVEELNQLTAEKYEKLRGSLRTSKPNWRPRMYTSFNPGGIGHVFVKTRYVIPHRMHQEKQTRFIGSTYKSNPYLNKEYIDYLEGLTGDLGKAWREGEWELFAGQFFSEFRMSLHTIHGFIPSAGDLIVGGCDWGRAKPFSFHLATVERVTFEEETFYRVKTFFEIYGTEKNPDEWSNAIKKKLKGYNLNIGDVSWVRADSKIFDKLDDGSVSIRDQFVDADHRWHLILPANKDRIQGWSVMHDWLSLAPDGKPYWQITETCPNLIRTLPELIHDENHVEDVDTEGEDHAGDDQRYMLKHLKWIGAKLGAVRENARERAKTGLFLQKDDNGKQIGVDIDRFVS